jgi:hypothetical protein
MWYSAYLSFSHDKMCLIQVSGLLYKNGTPNNSDTIHQPNVKYLSLGGFKKIGQYRYAVQLSSKSKKDERKHLLHAREKAACLCVAEKEQAQLNGEDFSVTRQKDTKYTVKLEGNLPSKSLPYHTIQSQMKRNNLSGKTIQSTENIEPLIVEYCQRWAQIGYSLTKDQVVTLAEDLIDKTEYFNCLKNCKKKNINVSAQQLIAVEDGWVTDGIGTS